MREYMENSTILGINSLFFIRYFEISKSEISKVNCSKHHNYYVFKDASDIQVATNIKTPKIRPPLGLSRSSLMARIFGFKPKSDC